MSEIDYVLSMVFHKCGVVTNEADMGMNVACTILNMLLECNNCKNTIDSAIKGHLKCLKFLHKNGCEWSEGVCSESSKYGHLECLKYAHENGCKWNEWTCMEAARKGHFECLKYACDNKCPGYEKYI